MEPSTLFTQGPAIAETLLQIFRVQGHDPESVAVLEASKPRVEFLRWDGWNEETAHFDLRLSIPAVLFASLESDLSKIEKRIAAKLERLRLAGENERLASCSISPQLLAGPGPRVVQTPTSNDVSRIWGSGQVRLFLSHVSKYKGLTAEVKASLSRVGVSGFVAHEDIEPSLEWQKEIETALQTMDVMCALLTPDFKDSKWTDQEVGIALGRRVPVIPVRLGMDPYGFIGKLQGVTATITRPIDIASKVFAAMMLTDALRKRVMESLVNTVVEAPSYSVAIEGMKRIEAHNDLVSAGQVERLLRAARDNSQVKGAFGVAKQIQAIAMAAKGSLPAVAQGKDLSDDIPF
jgi:TIR domain